MTRTSTPRCVTCARTTGHVQFHHVAGQAHLPDVTVPVCRSRHLGQWHRAMRSGGVNLSAAGSQHAKLTAVAVGFRIVLEDGCALEDDPAAARASIRSLMAWSLDMIDTALGVDGTPTLPSRRMNPRPACADCACAPCPPRTQAERRERAHAFTAGVLPAVTALLDSLLPTQLRTLDLPSRLRRIDPAALGDASLGYRGSEVGRRAASMFLEAFNVDLDSEQRLGVLGRALDLCVSELERMARAEPVVLRDFDA